MNQELKFDYDVIVIGTGPAGISVASELAQKFKVLVVDSRVEVERGTARLGLDIVYNNLRVEKATRTHKSWFCPHDSFFDNPDLKDCRKPGGVTRYLAKTYSGPSAQKPEEFDLAWTSKLFGSADLKDRYPYIDEYKVLAHWEQKLMDAPTNSKILGNHFYRDHETFSDHVSIRFIESVDSKKVARVMTCRLLLDATGHDSDIRKYYGEEQKDMYWWSVFGAIAKHPEGEIVTEPTPGHPLVVGDYMLWQTFADTNLNPKATLRQGRPIFEYEILDKTTSFPLILFLRPYKMSPERMKAEFLSVMEHESATEPFRNIDIEEFKYGWYPSGGLSQSFAQNRVDFIGDAGLWTTPCGWGMSFILKNYAPYARKITQLLQNDQLDQKSLKELSHRHSKKAEFFMNSLVTRFLSFGTADQLDKFIALFHKVDPIICEKIFTLRAEFKDLWKIGLVAIKEIGIIDILKVLPKKEIPTFIYSFFGMLFQFGKEGIKSAIWGIKPERGFGIFEREANSKIRSRSNSKSPI